MAETALTAWQETGPSRMTDLGEPGERRWLSANSYVLRVSDDVALAELAESLALTAPVTMTEDDRRQWLSAAVRAMRDAEPSPVAFAAAVRAARISTACDHPAKILPAIMKALGEFDKQIVTVETDATIRADIDRAIRAASHDAAITRLRLNQMTEAEYAMLPRRTREVAWHAGVVSTHWWQATQSQFDDPASTTAPYGSQ